jgi:hypothetical protein
MIKRAGRDAACDGVDLNSEPGLGRDERGLGRVNFRVGSRELAGAGGGVKVRRLKNMKKLRVDMDNLAKINDPKLSRLKKFTVGTSPADG